MRTWLVALVLLCSCGAVSGGQGNLPLPTPPTDALAKWNGFPANAKPRPIIIFDRSLEQIGPAGFTSEPNRKLDWGCFKFAFAAGVRLPATAPDRATAGGGTYPSIGATRAYSELMAKLSSQANSAPSCASAAPFVIKSVRWGTAGFPTDRGTMTMSAWLFDIGEIEAHLAYSALEPASFWGGAVNAGGGGSARVSADGITLKIPVGNEGTGKCDSQYTASAAESSSAVAVGVRQFPNASPGEVVGCPLPLRLSYISVHLGAPLGGRVVVNQKGDVMSVCPETEWC